MDVDFELKCRGCLGQDEHMVSIFESVDSTMLCENLMRCAPVHITEGDGGPTRICKECLEDLSTALKFREKCELSDKKIRSLIKCNGEVLEDVCDKLDNVKFISDFGIKEEISNDDNCYDFFDSSLSLKNGILEGFKLELSNEEHQIISSKNTKETDVTENAKYKECNVKIKKKKKKVCSEDGSRFSNNIRIISNTSKRGRKPKTPGNIGCSRNVSEIKVEYDCSVCTKVFTDLKNYKVHSKIHSKSRDHTCDQCGKQFKYKDNLKVHYMTHSGEKPFKCDLCEKSFSKKDNLAIHRRRHLKERNYSCHECGSAYYTSYELKTHMRVHTGEKPHVCTLCGKRFTAKNNLYIHQRSHTGEKPHVCTVCGKQFTSKNILSIHSRTHTGEKPYICSVCGKRFAANKLAVHMRIHTGEKPHVCPLCGKQFSASNVLAIHMRRHTGEKPYECKLCGQTYGHTQSLNKHMRKQHKIVTNAHQIQMQQINEAHQALLEENIICASKELDKSSHPLTLHNTTETKLLNQKSSKDLVSLTPEIPKLT